MSITSSSWKANSAENKNVEGSHTFVIGLGPRLWPDQDSRIYAAGGLELQLSNENDKWFSVLLEGGVGF